MSDKVTVNAQMLIHKPQNLTLSEAATIPVAYLTSYYCLVEIAQMKAGDKVLIHAASGGVGQAAIALALLVGAEVYATASPSKWQFVQSLGVKHVFNSRSLDFGAQIMEKTQGEGVDIVLNSLTGEGFIENSLLVLKDDGHFLEISKSGVWQEAQIANIKPNVKYALIDLVQTCQQSPALTNSMLTSLMTLFNQGKLLPLAKEEFKLSRAVEAFRHMQQAKHIGKIVLTNDRLNTKPNHEWQSAIELKDDASYLITGGAGGLGLLVADWLVKQGAKHLVLVGRSEATTELDSNIEKLQQAGAKVMFVQADVANYQQLESVLNTIESNFPPLKGVIHSAGVLADGVLSEQNWQRFETVFAPKVQGAWHLHRLTADMNLDFFTLFSSAAALFGSIGQANHSAANSYLDMLAHYRRAQGLAAMSINWGAWSEIGAAAARDADVAMGKKGAGSIAPRQGIQILAQLFAAPTTQVGVVPLDPTQLPDMAFYANLAANESDLGNQITDNSSDFMSQLAALDSLKEKREHLVNNVQQQVAKVLGFSQSDTVDVHKGFFDLGMDSLTAVELKNRLQSALGCTLSSTLLFKYSTVTELCKYLSDEVFQLTDEPTLDDMPNTDITDTQDLAQDLTQDHEQTISEEIGQLSEQDLEALIDSSLDFLDEKDL